MTRRRTTAGMLLATATIALIAGLVQPNNATAAVLGGSTFSPTTGDQDTNIVMTTAGVCPAAADALTVLVTGGDDATPSSKVTDGVMVGVSDPAAYPVSGGGYVIPLTLTFKDFAQANGFTPIKGDYLLTARCRSAASPASLGDYIGTLRWTNGAGAFDGTYLVVATAATPTPTATATATPTATPTASPSASASPSTATASPSASASASASPSATASPTAAATSSPTEAATPTSGATPTETATVITASGSGTAGLGSGGTSGSGTGAVSGQLPLTGTPLSQLLRLAFGLLAAGALAVAVVVVMTPAKGRHLRRRDCR